MAARVSDTLDDDGINEWGSSLGRGEFDGEIDFGDAPGLVEEEGVWEGGLEGGGPGGEFAKGTTPKEPDCAGGVLVAKKVGDGGGDGAVPGEEADAEGERGRGGCS